MTPKLLQVQPSGLKALRDDQAKYLKGVVDKSTTFDLLYVSPHQHVWFCFSDPCLVDFLMKEESASLLVQAIHM